MRTRLLILVWMAAAVAVLPAIFRWQPPAPATGFALQLRLGAGYFLALALCYSLYRREARRLSRSQAFSVAFLAGLLTTILNYLHHLMVNYGPDYFAETSNADWQAQLQRDIMRFLPNVAPHAARFLPNAIVRWLELGGMDFEAARDLYRLIFVLLLFYAIYRYARLYTTHQGALAAMLLVAVVYPVTFHYYAGQLTDPLSHLSFVLAFLFLEKEDFPFLFATILIGSLAKETVLALTGYYILFCRKDRRYPLKAGALAAGSSAAYFGVRLYVLGGTMHYSDISGVTLAHVADNWQTDTWKVPFLLTALSLVPFLAVGWRTTPRALKRMALFLLPVLFFSSLFFSWLDESRDYMPAVFVLAVIAARTLAGETADGPLSGTLNERG